AELAAKAGGIISIIGSHKDVDDVSVGAVGIIANAKEGRYSGDMTPPRPALAEKISHEADKTGLFALAARVSVGDVCARNAKLTIIVGGDQKAFDKILPILQYMGENIVLQGPAGAGQHTKAVNQIAIAPGMIGVCEALIYAKESGLDPTTVLSSIETGAAGS